MCTKRAAMAQPLFQMKESNRFGKSRVGGVCRGFGLPVGVQFSDLTSRLSTIMAVGSIAFIVLYISVSDKMHITPPCIATFLHL